MQHLPNGVYSIYGDPAYPLSPYLLAPFGGASITSAEDQFNKSMSACSSHHSGMSIRPYNLAVSFCCFCKNLKILLWPVGLHYIIATLLSNCHTWIYSNQSAEFFNLVPPHLKTICSKCDVSNFICYIKGT